MSARRIVCIVEGEGERGAVPILVNRILRHLRRERVIEADSERIICTKNGDCITHAYAPERQLGIEFYVERAAREKPAAILVVVDAEDRCVARLADGEEGLGVHLRARAEPKAGGIPLGVVVANRMFESWFLADFHSLRSRGHLPSSSRLPQWKVPESLGGCKGRMKELLGRPYSETRDQPRLSAELSLPTRPAMQRRSPSLWKLFREVRKLSR